MSKKLLLLFIILTVSPALWANYYMIEKTEKLEPEKDKDYNFELHNKTKKTFEVALVYRKIQHTLPPVNEEIYPNEYLRIAGFDIKKTIGIGISEKGKGLVGIFSIEPNENRDNLYIKLETDSFGELKLKPQRDKDNISKSGKKLINNVSEKEIKKAERKK